MTAQDYYKREYDDCKIGDPYLMVYEKYSATGPRSFPAKVWDKGWHYIGSELRPKVTVTMANSFSKHDFDMISGKQVGNSAGDKRQKLRAYRQTFKIV